MSDNKNNTTAAAAATSNNLDVLLLAVSMAAPSPNSRSGTSSLANSHMKTAVGPSMSAPKSTSDSYHQLHANNHTSATLPLVTPPTSIELLDGHAAAADMPIFSEPSADMKRSHHDSFFTSSSSSLPAPKMTNNPSMFITNNSLPIKKRFTNREGGPMVVSGTFATNGGSTTRLQSNVATATTQTASTPPPPVNKNNKKEKKKYRKPSCSHPSCPNRVMNRGVCARHGARVRICSIPECSKYAQKGGVCIRHGAKKEYKRCSVEGCNARASAAGSSGRSSGGRRSVCSRHALTCYSVGSIVVVPAVADGGTREEARQDVNSGRRIDEEDQHQKQQQRETL
uniref:WRKY19-like zinc finger domain-containing protein n=1 Tax=Skeletonema marinoi TaxID=267567 RepID=A0A7S2PVJ2_9STRA